MIMISVLMGCQADEAVMVDDILFFHEVPQGFIDGLSRQ
jgi:hypothetical protein